MRDNSMTPSSRFFYTMDSTNPILPTKSEGATWHELHRTSTPDEFMATVLACLAHENGGEIELPDRSLRDFLVDTGRKFHIRIDAAPSDCGLVVRPATSAA
jgi:hypothetical protein